MNHKTIYSSICLFFLLSSSFCGSALADDSFISGYRLEVPMPITPDSCLVLDEESSPQPRGLNSITEVQITPEIQALARALDNNPVRIYEYVRNNIDYVPLLGVRNGATATLLSKRGNDADQCSLLIALLKAANPESDAVYARGYVVYPVSFMANLLNVDANTNQVLSRLWGGLIPSDVDPNVASSIRVYRYWVETTISNTTYKLDPAYKEYDSTNALDILSIAGYSRTQFTARATSGATVTTNSIRNANEANIRADLTAYSSNLVVNIRAQHPNDDISGVLGVRKIKRHIINTMPTSLTNAVGMYTPTNAAVLPDYHYWNLAIQLPGHTGITMNLYEISGKRVSIFFTGPNNAPQLWVNGSVKATGSATTNGQICSMTVTLSRTSFSYVGGKTNDSYVFRLTSGHSYLLANDFGAACPVLIGNVSEQLARDRDAGMSEASEAVLGGAMHLMGLSYFNQITQQKNLIGHLTRVSSTEHYGIGLVAQEEGYFIDVPMARISLEHFSGDSAKSMAFFRSTAMLHSALEHGMLEQMQGTNRPAVSTAKLLTLNNATNKEAFFANSANWSGASGVRTQLVNYTSQELSALDSSIASGMTAILPKDAAITLAQWTGVGYVVYGPTRTSMTISGGYNGGFGAFADELISILVEFSAADAYLQLPPVHVFRPESLEPVDLASGDYLFENVDLEMGGAEPRGIRFVRQYNSAQSARDSQLRHGWMHNYDIRAFIHSNPELVLGGRQATDAASIAVSSLITSDLLENDLSARGWITASLATKWAMDQMIDNAVNIQMGNKSLVYVKLPDGTYNPPPSVTATLSKNSGVFRLRDRLGAQYDFNTNNLISAWRDADSNTLSFIYNAQTNLSAVTNGYGRGFTFTYSGATQLTAVADSSGRSVSYGYSAGNLTSYTDAESKVWTYIYDSNHWMRALVDPLSQTTVTNTYDSLGMVVTQKNAMGNSWAFFVVPGWRSVEQDPFGGSTTYYFDDNGRQIAIEDALGNLRRVGYDGQGHVTDEIDARGFQTRYQYDSNHNLTNVVDALTNSTAFTYDSLHRLVSVRDALGHITQYGYDAEHHVTNVVDALTNQTAMTYRTDGLPQTVTGPRGETTSYTYDSYGNPATITRTDGGAEMLSWNARGDLLTWTDANTNTTTTTYDKRRLLTSLRDPYQQRITNIYNNAGLLVTRIDKRNGTNITTYTPTYKVASIRYPDGGIVSNYYDAADRLVHVRDPLGFITTNQYDLAGRLIRVVDPLGNAVSNAYDAAGNLLSVRNAAGNVFSNQYDALNRLVRSIDPLGQMVSNCYDAAGRRVVLVNQNGNRTEYEYDALGRVTMERREGLEHRFEYDAAGNRTANVNPKTERMGFGYDKMNRLVAETNAIGRVTRMVYDAAGNLRQKINANGQTNFFGYNALNQLTNRVSGAENIALWYDPNGNLTNMVDSLGTTRQIFDAMNRLVQVVDAFGQTVSNQYNLVGQRTQIVYPGGKSEAFAYDGASRLTNVQASAFGLSATSYGYDSRNNLTCASLPGGLAVSNFYDALNCRLAWSVSKAGSNLLARSCARNPLGFRTNETIAAGLDALAGPATQTRTHDAADRLTLLTQSGSAATNMPFFDAAGNVTQLVVTAKGQTFTTRYGYDFNNRLTAVTRLRNAPDGASVTTAVTQLEYDGQGLLLRITEDGNVHRLVRDRTEALARPLVEMGATTNAVRWFVWANGKLLAQIASNGIIHVAHSDELGKILALTDGTGAITDEFAYQPYGRMIAHSGTNDLPFAFMGDYGVWNAGNGLSLTRHRAYDANLMRFLQPDPIGLEGGYNLYTYASGNPLWFIDPLGLVAWGTVGRGVAGAGVSVIGMVAGVAATPTGALTGPGAALAYVSAYSFGANVGNIINGFRDVPASPTGPVGTVATLATDNRTMQTAANITDAVIPLVIAGRIEWSRLPTQPGGLPGTLAGTLERVPMNPSVAYPALRAFEYGYLGLQGYDYLIDPALNARYNDDPCK
jgi:RHS repeat-associated protein